MFKGLEAEMGRPKVYDGENYLSYPVRYIQEEMVVEKTSDIQIFIFNISKIFTRGDTNLNFTSLMKIWVALLRMRYVRLMTWLFVWMKRIVTMPQHQRKRLII